MAARKNKKNALPKRRTRLHADLVLPPGTKLVHNMPGQIKMSEVMQEFIAPYRDLARDESEVRHLLMLALVAWNASMIPERMQNSEPVRRLIEGIAAVPGGPFAAAAEVVAALTQRKLDHFAAIHRKILSFDFVDRGDDFNLSIVSTADLSLT